LIKRSITDCRVDFNRAYLFASYFVVSRRPFFIPVHQPGRWSRRGMGTSSKAPAFLFDLDGTLVDSVYQHVLAWREALKRCGMALAVWRIHRRIGMSGGLVVNALLRETGHPVTPGQTEQLPQFHAEAYACYAAQL